MKPSTSVVPRLTGLVPVAASLAMIGVFTGICGHPSVAADPPTATKEAGPAAPQALQLATSDGVELSAWYYAVDQKEEKTPRGVVILVHDLEGSHKTVEPLAKGLQQLGFAVVAPDLRGHGASTASAQAGGSTLEAKSLRKNDLLAIAATAGGRVREQALVRGDLEAVRGWIKRQSDAGELDIGRLCIVGCGAGGTLATLWTMADAAWPPTTSGPQGRQVRGLVLVSPAWTVKGVSLQPALKTDITSREVPILIVSGKGDRDAIRLVDQYKNLRPKAWFVQQPGKKPETAGGLTNPTDASLFSVQLDTTLSADKLTADRSTNAATVIATFLGIALDRGQ